MRVPTIPRSIPCVATASPLPYVSIRWPRPWYRVACALISQASRAEADTAALLFAVTTVAGVTMQAVIGARAVPPPYSWNSGHCRPGGRVRVPA
jgi:hypothetical protein